MKRRLPPCSCDQHATDRVERFLAAADNAARQIMLGLLISGGIVAACEIVRALTGWPA